MPLNVKRQDATSINNQSNNITMIPTTIYRLPVYDIHTW